VTFTGQDFKNLILKGGFLIAAMIGVDKRATMDMDTTVIVFLTLKNTRSTYEI
jgi:hypothetical protein